MIYREDSLHPGFTKHVLDIPLKDGELCRAAVHHFTEAESKDALPHCHPFDIVSHVLRNSYVEEIYHIEKDGSWWMEVLHRKEGEKIIIKADTIHKLIQLPEGDCVTAVVQSEPYREWRHWQFDKRGIYSRAWHEQEFTTHNP